MMRLVIIAMSKVRKGSCATPGLQQAGIKDKIGEGARVKSKFFKKIILLNKLNSNWNIYLRIGYNQKY